MTKEIASLTLEELKPQAGSFKLSTKPDKEFHLRVFSLAERIWLKKKYTKSEITRIFNEQDIEHMAEIAHHLLTDKTEFPDFLSFAQSVVTVTDQIELTKALLKTIGIDDKLILSLSKKLDGEDPNAEAVQTPSP